MATYVGGRHQGRAIVSVIDDRTKRASMLDGGYRYVNHSPTGFEWGYLGSGPAQLAFAILLDHFGAAGEALLFYQDFKVHIVSMLNTDTWALTTAEIEAALERIRILRTRARRERNWQEST